MDRLWAMEVFVRVVEAGNFSRAATSLGLANATVTSCINNLEKHLGVTLIRRNTRQLRLTDEGVEYFAQCQPILKAVAVAESSIKSNIEQMSGALRIEVPISIGQALICPALTEFSKRHPQTSVAVTLTNQPHNLIERAIDVAIRMGHVEDVELIVRPIYEARYVICGTADLVKRAAEDPSMLDPSLCLGLLTENNTKPVEWTLSRESEKVVIRPSGPLSFNNSHSLVDVALGGAGMICILDIFVNRYLATGELLEAYSDWTTSTKTFYAVTSKTRATSIKIHAFIDFLLETLDSQRRPNPNRLVEVRSLKKRA